MAADARATSHAIEQHVTNELEALNSFDSDITYSKGEALLRMLEAYIGEDVFRQGIRSYIKNRAYSNAAAADLWNALEKASGKNVPAVAAQWIEKPGFPLVNVTATCDSVRKSQRNPKPEAVSVERRQRGRQCERRPVAGSVANSRRHRRPAQRAARHSGSEGCSRPLRRGFIRECRRRRLLPRPVRRRHAGRRTPGLSPVQSTGTASPCSTINGRWWEAARRHCRTSWRWHPPWAPTATHGLGSKSSGRSRSLNTPSADRRGIRHSRRMRVR